MRLLISTAVLLALLMLGAYLLRPSGSQEVRTSMVLSEAMAGDTTGYNRAVSVRPLDFPADYGAHPGFKTEWWYYTGNLETSQGRRFGYELTIFRTALAPPDSVVPGSSGDWSTNQLFMGHFSFADPEGGEFFAFERLSRGAAGLAGARSMPYRVWLEDWTIESVNVDSGDHDGDIFPNRLHASTEAVAIDLELESAKPVVLQGDSGLDQKGPGDGNASYYYSFTRLPTQGTVTVDGQRFDVTGSSWKDHEWSTSALGEDQVGWDWFALQLSNGRDIMFYQLRRRDGTVSPYTNGIVVAPDGSTRHLTTKQVEIDVLDEWTSPHSGATYPSGWRFGVPSERLDLRITPLMRDQELNVSVRYWEGAVDISGTGAAGSVSGRGYVELTGYGDEPAGSVGFSSSRTVDN